MFGKDVTVIINWPIKNHVLWKKDLTIGLSSLPRVLSSKIPKNSQIQIIKIQITCMEMKILKIRKNFNTESMKKIQTWKKIMKMRNKSKILLTATYCLWKFQTYQLIKKNCPTERFQSQIFIIVPWARIKKERMSTNYKVNY